jgi:predicted nucleic acid-binding protein
MRAFLHEIVPFGEPQARLATDLFQAAGRRRSARVDAMIAATAILAGAPLVTNNTADFDEFRALGPALVQRSIASDHGALTGAESLRAASTAPAARSPP